jgi:formylglycine-generating enzyme required for sulfatase activity
MSRHRGTLWVVAAGAAALPAALALLASGSCSLVQLYSGALDGGQGGAAATIATSTGSSGGSDAGDSADAAGDTGADAGSDAPSCPIDMVEIPNGTTSYCIDQLEVTNHAYAQFLAMVDAGAAPQPPGKCTWDVDYAPAVALDAGDDLPVLGVDWCDAYAYCAWANKRLCGAIGGGPIAPGLRDTDNGQWYAACSRKALRVYPYSAYTFNVATCADCDPGAACNVDASAAQPVNVGSKKGCEGGYVGLFDLSGNAAEWEDGCNDGGLRPDASDDAGQAIPDPRYDLCYPRGGSFELTGSSTGAECLACATTTGCPLAGAMRQSRPRDVGVRCCLDL